MPKFTIKMGMFQVQYENILKIKFWNAEFFYGIKITTIIYDPNFTNCLTIKICLKWIRLGIKKFQENKKWVDSKHWIISIYSHDRKAIPVLIKCKYVLIC